MPTLLTNVGIAGMIGKLNANTPPRYVAWGTGGATSPAADQTTLAVEAAEARTQGANTVEKTDVTDDTYQVVGTITSEGTQTISEAGLFALDEAGDMYIRGNFTGIPLAEHDAIQFTMKIVLEQPGA
jgi:hypothetical protein